MLSRDTIIERLQELPKHCSLTQKLLNYIIKFDIQMKTNALLVLIYVLQIVSAASSFTFVSVSSNQISAISNYSITITRAGTAQLMSISLNFTNGFNFSLTNSTINSYSYSSNSSSAGILAYQCNSSIYSASTFNIILTNVTNPWYAMSLYKVVTCTFIDTNNNSQVVTYQGSQMISKGFLKSCNMVFSSYVNTVGSLNLTLVTTNAIPAGSGINAVMLTYSSTYSNIPSNSLNPKGIVTTNNSLQTISVTSPITSSLTAYLMTYSSTSMSIGVNNTTPITAGTTLTVIISGVNSPPTQTTPDSFTVTTTTNNSNTLYAVDYTSSCSVSATTAYSLSGSFASTSKINTNLTSTINLSNTGNNQIQVTNDTLIITFPTGVNFSAVNTVYFDSALYSVYGTPVNQTSNTESFSLSLNGGVSTLCPSNQSFVVTLGTITMPPSISPTNILITFYRKSSRYMIATVPIYPTSGGLSNVSINPSPNVVGKNATYSISFVVQDQISTSGGVIIIFPSTLTITNAVLDTSVYSNGSIVISGQKITIAGLFVNTVAKNQIISLNLNQILNALSTAPTTTFNISTYNNISDLTTLIDTDASTSVASIPNTIPDPVTVTSSSSIANALSTYTITYINQVSLSSNTMVSVVIPTGFSISSSTINVTLSNGSYQQVGSINNSNNITISLGSALIFGSSITLSISLMNYQYVGAYSFQIYQSVGGYAIENKTSNILANIVTPAAFTSFTLSLSNSQTGAISIYSLSLSPSITHSANSTLYITLPTDITYSSSSCLSSNCNNLTYYNSTTLSININVTMNTFATYVFNLTNIKNSRSKKPQTIQIISYYNGVAVNIGSTTLTLSSSSPLYISFSSSAINYYLSTDPISLCVVNTTNQLYSTDYFYIQLSSFFTIGSNISCSQTYLNCTLFSSGIKASLYQNQSAYPSSITLTIIGATTGKNSSGTITVTTFDLNSYQIDSSSPLSYALNCSYSLCAKCNPSVQTYCYSCYTDTSITSHIYIYNNTCSNNCQLTSSQLYSLNYTCVTCVAPCLSCTSQTICTSCSNSSYYLYSNDSSCRSTCNVNFIAFYTYSSNNVNYCAQCASNCSSCNSSNTCTTCLNTSMVAYNGTCLSSCPLYYYNSSAICLACDSSCYNCSGPLSTNCYTCRDTTYYTVNTTGQCVQVCPNGTAANQVTRQCTCNSNCLTCQQNLSNCVTCYSENYLYSGTCYSSCPNGTYANNSQCVSCITACLTCTSTTCLQCFSQYYLYNNQCVTDCNGIDSQLENDNSTFTCIKCSTGCSTCNVSQVGFCYSCLSNYSLNQSADKTSYSYCQLSCLGTNTCNSSTITCTIGLYYNGSTCVNILTQAATLSVVSFGASTGVVVSFGILSKLLLKSTYLPYCLMSFMSVLETISYIPVVSRSSSSSSRRLLTISLTTAGTYCLIFCLSLNYVLNLVHLLIYKKYLLKDIYFSKNKRNPGQKCVNTVLLIIATLTNYRFYQITFSSICNLKVFNTQLVNLSRLTPLNILNSINLAGSIVAVAGSLLICSEGNIHQTNFVLALVCLIITIINMIATLLSFVKEENFFEGVVAQGKAKETTTNTQQNIVAEGERYQFFNSRLSAKAKKSVNQTLSKINETSEFEEEVDGDQNLGKKQKVIDPLKAIYQKPISHSVAEKHRPIEFQSQFEGVLNQKVGKTSNKKRRTAGKFPFRQEKKKSLKSLQIVQSNAQATEQQKVQTIINALSQSSQSEYNPYVQKSTVQRGLNNVLRENTSQERDPSQNPNLATIEEIPIKRKQNQSSVVLIKSKIQNRFSDKSQDLMFETDKSSQNSYTRKGQTTIDLQFVEKFYQQPAVQFVEPDIDYQEISPSKYNVQNQRYETEDLDKYITHNTSFKRFDPNQLIKSERK